MTKKTAKKLYISLIRARKFDEKVAELYSEQEMKCPVHLSLGQEGSAAGVCAALETKDKVWASHRCHAVTVAKGAKFGPLFAELYGRKTGCSQGKAGSMHFIAPEVGVMGASAIVGASIPLALGSAMAAKIRKEDFVSVAFFGDGALEQGTFHESLNFASLHKLPVIFVLENNNLSTATPLAKRQVNPKLWEHAKSYLVPSVRIDGSKPEKIYEFAEKAVGVARKGRGPMLLEIICERWSAHVLTNAKYEPVIGKKDPVRNFEIYVTKNKLLTTKGIENIKKDIEQEIDDSIKFAKSSAYPTKEALYSHV